MGKDARDSLAVFFRPFAFLHFSIVLVLIFFFRLVSLRPRFHLRT